MQLWRIEVRKGPNGLPLAQTVVMGALRIDARKPVYTSDAALAAAAGVNPRLFVADLGDVEDLIAKLIAVNQPSPTVPSPYETVSGLRYLDACGFRYGAAEADAVVTYDFVGTVGSSTEARAGYTDPADRHSVALKGKGLRFRLDPARWLPERGMRLVASVLFKVSQFDPTVPSVGTPLRLWLTVPGQQKPMGVSVYAQGRFSGGQLVDQQLGLLEDSPTGQRTFTASFPYAFLDGAWHQIVLDVVAPDVQTQPAVRTKLQYRLLARPVDNPDPTLQKVTSIVTSQVVAVPAELEVASTRASTLLFDDFIAVRGQAGSGFSSDALGRVWPAMPKLAYRSPAVAVTEPGGSGLIGQVPGIGAAPIPGVSWTTWEPQRAANFLEAIRSFDGDASYVRAVQESRGTIDFFPDLQSAQAWATGKTRLFAHAGFVARGGGVQPPGTPFGRVALVWDEVDREPGLAPRAWPGDAWQTYRAYAAMDLTPEILPIRAVLVGHSPARAEVPGFPEASVVPETQVTHVYAVYGYR